MGAAFSRRVVNSIAEKVLRRRAARVCVTWASVGGEPRTSLPRASLLPWHLNVVFIDDAPRALELVVHALLLRLQVALERTRVSGRDDHWHAPGDLNPQ